ncbi:MULTISPECIES: AbgT family transporter [unclassified Oleiphilus]|uniref:AbgT family transporter n=4 Tax=Oleiphilus TaxID=141450 RepID=UPI0007C2BACB|nr:MULTISPECIES: AbgT family transporter [unclassified Oleiphilus]KZY66551.1 aminobenzoyl-glutamate transporter [Oleiphilus sp. HI0066]KZY69608.1 aminobenzoyl-glutamate transporter [Oleiphilus sp. HI0067]
MSTDHTQSPQTPNNDQSSGSKNFITRFLDTVEFLGNLLPHPVILFAILCALVIVISGVAGYFELAVLDPRPEGSRGRSPSGMIEVVSLFNIEGLQQILTQLVKNFTGFTPLGTVLVALLGVGIAERSGVISAAMRNLVMGAPKKLVTFAVVLAGIVSNTAAELGYVVLIPLSAMIFASLGRHPLAGLAAAFAGVSGGYSANLLIGTVDPLLSGISEKAAQLIDPSYTVGAEANWYFMMASTVVISILGMLITEYIVEPQLGLYNKDDASPEHVEELEQEMNSHAVTDIERKGLRVVGIYTLIFAGVLASTIVPENGILRHPETGLVAGSPFLKSILAFIFIYFALAGLVYGKVVKSITNSTDVVHAMNHAMNTMGAYIVLVFFAAQFVAFFKWTNLGAILAVLGAQTLESLGLTGPILFFFFIGVCGLINLSLGSASAQWAVTAPIFIPMLMLVGYSPEVIQAAYRIGDSTTNIITPMMSYFGLILAVAEKYKKDLGIGTLISMMLPYSVVFITAWSLFFYFWVFIMGFPVGPGAPIYYTM